MNVEQLNLSNSLIFELDRVEKAIADTPSIMGSIRHLNINAILDDADVHEIGDIARLLVGRRLAARKADLVKRLAALGVEVGA